MDLASQVQRTKRASKKISNFSEFTSPPLSSPFLPFPFLFSPSLSSHLSPSPLLSILARNLNLFPFPFLSFRLFSSHLLSHLPLSFPQSEVSENSKKLSPYLGIHAS